MHTRHHPDADADTVAAVREANQLVTDCAEHLHRNPGGHIEPLTPPERIQGLLAYNAFRAAAPVTTFA